MAKTNIKEIIKQCLHEVLSEELDVPSQDGSSDGADPDDKEKAKKASQSGDTVKFVKPGDIKEKKKDDDKEDDDDDKKDDKKSEKKDDKKSDKKDDKKDDKKSEKKSGDEGEVEEEAVPSENIGQLLQTLSSAAKEIEELQTYSSTSQDKKMAGTLTKLAQNMQNSMDLINQLKTMKESLVQEDVEKSNEFGDKVIKCLSKNFKDEKSGAKLKEKYMPFIAMGYKKGKKPQEIAERISQHRFEM